VADSDLIEAVGVIYEALKSLDDEDRRRALASVTALLGDEPIQAPRATIEPVRPAEQPPASALELFRGEDA